MKQDKRVNFTGITVVVLICLVAVDLATRLWPYGDTDSIHPIMSVSAADGEGSQQTNVQRAGLGAMDFPPYAVEKGRMRLFHVGLIVEDLDKSIEFYRDKLGFRIMRVQDMGIQRVAFVSTGDGEPLIELIDVSKPLPGYPSEGFSHLGIFTDDVDRLYEKTSSVGVEWATKPGRPGPGAPYMGFISDPDGYRIEVMGNPDGSRCINCHRGPHLN